MMETKRQSTPTLEEQAAFHDEWNTAYRDVGIDDIEDESKARAAKVLEYLSGLELARPEILEAGCGSGWLTAKLCEFGPCTGIDLSGKAIDIAKRRGLSANFIAGDFSQTQFPAGHFDVVVLVETIAYVEDQRAFLEKIANYMKPGGYLILTTVNTFVYNRRSDIGPPKPGQVRKWLTRGELATLLRQSFRVLAYNRAAA